MYLTITFFYTVMRNVQYDNLQYTQMDNMYHDNFLRNYSNGKIFITITFFYTNEQCALR